MLSTQISKYNLFSITDEEKTKFNKKLKINPLVQTKIINSFIDIFNSIIENYLFIKNHKNNYSSSIFQLYDIITLKFFTKLNDVYTNKNVIDKFKEKIIKTISISNNIKEDELLGEMKIEYALEDEDIKNILNIKNNILFNDKSIKSITYGDLNYNNSLICIDGNIHEWNKEAKKLNFDGKDVKCMKCGKKISEIFNKDKYDEKLYNNFINNKLNIIGNKYCPDGKPHLFIFEKNIKKCKLCGYVIGDKLKEKDINKLKDNFYKYVMIENNKKIDKINIDTIFNKLKDKYNKEILNNNKNIFNYFSKYLIEKIGNKINIDNNEIFIQNNIYTFNHNNIGYNLKENLEINEDKINFVLNHPFYKEDVYYYTTSNKIEVYYSLITNKLLGYKEQQKNYVKLNSKNNYYSIINYSLLTRFKYLFFDKFFTTINKQTNIYDIIYNMFILVFNFINKLFSFIFMINNKKKFIEKKEVKNIKIEIEDLINKDNKQLEEITHKKFMVEKYYSNNYDIDKNEIFRNWYNILYSIMYNIDKEDNIKEIEINTVIDNFNILSKYKFFDYLYFYLIDEIIYMDKKYNIINFIVDYINYFFINNSSQLFINNVDYIQFIEKINCDDPELEKLLSLDEEEVEKAKKQMENLVEGTDDGQDEENDGYNLYQDGDDDSDDDNLDGDINGLNRESGLFDLNYS